jgi:hypothetical protein
VRARLAQVRWPLAVLALLMLLMLPQALAR